MHVHYNSTVLAQTPAHGLFHVRLLFFTLSANPCPANGTKPAVASSCKERWRERGREKGSKIRARREEKVEEEREKDIMIAKYRLDYNCDAAITAIQPVVSLAPPTMGSSGSVWSDFAIAKVSFPFL